MRIRDIIGSLALIASIILIVGAVGGAEQGVCTLSDMFKMCAIGFGGMFVSYLCNLE